MGVRVLGIRVAVMVGDAVSVGVGVKLAVGEGSRVGVSLGARVTLGARVKLDAAVAVGESVAVTMGKPGNGRKISSPATRENKSRLQFPLWMPARSIPL